METANADVPLRQTAAERRVLPDFRDVAEATAEKFDVCKRPIPMRVEDPKTLTVSYVAAPCKSTIESVCPACAKQARYLRMTQCREGWHLDAEPVEEPKDPTEQQTDLVAARSDLFNQYQGAKAEDDAELMAGIREIIEDLDRELRDSGFRGRLPALEERPATRRTRSTRRRQDAPNLPRRKVSRTTIGREFSGHRPSMFVTLTMPSYGGINQDGATGPDGMPCSDGSPRRPDEYDYTRAARDIVHFSALVDRWIQNLRRAVGYDVQYFASVEPQKRGAPHLHILLRGAISRDLLRQVTAATYHQVWWPHFDHEQYTADRMPVWDPAAMTFVDPDTRRPLTDWDQALDIMDSVDDLPPAHTVRFGSQMDRKHIRGVLGGTQEVNRHIGYVTKYLTKSIAEIVEPRSQRAAEHYDRLHAELQYTPCSPRCGVWLRYGIVPKGASDKTIPGKCRGKAHRRDTLGLPGRRVLVSRRWSGKTLPDHKQDRAEFVRQLLARVGIEKPDTSHLRVTPVQPGDQSVPPRDHLIMAAIAQRTAWRAQYTNALLAAAPPDTQDLSANQPAA
ncbi:helitron helicase-like domain-containing protein [Nocardia cyriacigeorgica]|uniref:helitron helicase-like domain-containing protein n=5 Tax=Nocardia cyriacigeorgica TaxID=135487 RepID=UPI001E63B412|nr:helitron helicase-like domain-containing protein [Nocardia cyriacigeorgica]